MAQQPLENGRQPAAIGLLNESGIEFATNSHKGSRMVIVLYGS